MVSLRTVRTQLAAKQKFAMPAWDTAQMARCLGCIIRDKGLCNALTVDELAQFGQIAHRRTYQPGQRILSSEDDTGYIGAISAGVVKVTKILVDGRQQIVSLLFPPDCLGRSFGKSNPYFAEAATNVEICSFERAGFERMVDDYAGLNKRLLEQTLDELDGARDWMILLGRKTAEEKVASLLLMLATRSQPSEQTDKIEDHQPPPADFELHLKRDEIADFLGLSYETVCRQIAALKKSGLVRFNGTRRFVVPNLDALAAVAG